MLDSLDTLIAFVVIMLVVSLLITILVQPVSSLFDLHGVNLLNGLASTFAVIAPDPALKYDNLASWADWSIAGALPTTTRVANTLPTDYGPNPPYRINAAAPLSCDASLKWVK